MKYIIDTSFFISLFLEEDINHEEAKNILKEKSILTNDVIMNPFIIEEVFTILTYKWWKKFSDNFFKSLKIFNIIYSSTSMEKYINFYSNVEQKISFADISIIYDWIYYNCELISFDKQQKWIFTRLIK